MNAPVKLAVAAAALISLTAAAAPAGAQQRSGQVFRAMNLETPPPGAPRIVMPCEQGAVARRNFERRFGQTPVFVTADEALAARDRGDVWNAPRCMTAREHARLAEMLG